MNCGDGWVAAKIMSARCQRAHLYKIGGHINHFHIIWLVSLPCNYHNPLEAQNSIPPCLIAPVRLSQAARDALYKFLENPMGMLELLMKSAYMLKRYRM